MSQPPPSPKKYNLFNSSKRGSSTQNPPSPPSDSASKRFKDYNSDQSPFIPEAPRDGSEIIEDDIENFATQLQQRDKLVAERMGNINIVPKPFTVPHIPPKNPIDPNTISPRPSRPVTPSNRKTLYNPLTGAHSLLTSFQNTPPTVARPRPSKPNILLPKATPPPVNKPYNELSHTWKLKIEEDVWNSLVSKHGEINAGTIVDKLYAKHGKKLTAAETIHVFNNCNVNASNAEKFQHEFRQHHIPSPFATRSKIDDERKKMHDDAEFEH